MQEIAGGINLVIKTLASVLFMVAVFAYISLFITVTWVSGQEKSMSTTLTKPTTLDEPFVLSVNSFSNQHIS